MHLQASKSGVCYKEVFMPEFLLLSFEIAGTVAFAVSGAILGLEKRMDILGISILGLTTAVAEV